MRRIPDNKEEYDEIKVTPPTVKGWILKGVAVRKQLKRVSSKHIHNRQHSPLQPDILFRWTPQRKDFLSGHNRREIPEQVRKWHGKQGIKIGAKKDGRFYECRPYCLFLMRSRPLEQKKRSFSTPLRPCLHHFGGGNAKNSIIAFYSRSYREICWQICYCYRLKRPRISYKSKWNKAGEMEVNNLLGIRLLQKKECRQLS